MPENIPFTHTDEREDRTEPREKKKVHFKIIDKQQRSSKVERGVKK